MAKSDSTGRRIVPLPARARLQGVAASGATYRYVIVRHLDKLALRAMHVGTASSFPPGWSWTSRTPVNLASHPAMCDTLARGAAVCANDDTIVDAAP